jgi:cytochrome c biogenesis protein CcdA
MRLLSRAALALLLAASAAAAAGGEDSSSMVEVAARAADPVPAGGQGRLEVKVTVAEGWHIYGPGDAYEAQVTRLAVTGGAEGLQIGPFLPDRPPKAHVVEFEEKPRMEYAGTVTWTATVAVPAGTPAGERTLRGTVTVNACDAGSCLAEGAAPWTAVLTVAAADPAAKPIPPPPSPPAAAPDPAPPRGISLEFLLAAVIGGLLTIATPCVFPMIPLTVSLLTKRAEKDPSRILPNALAYGAGMFVSLAGLGLAASLLFKVGPSDLALSPTFNLLVFAFLVYLALSLFGAYDIQLPSFLTDWAQGKAGAGGGAGLFFMGMTLAFTSFACAAPFAGVLVLEARKDLTLGIVGMSVYALTFTLPFFVTALFPGILARLPRSGGWLNAVKVVMGFVEVAAAFKFLRGADQLLGWGIFSFEAVLAIWVACSVGASAYLLGWIVLPHDTKPESIGVGRLLWALAFLATGLALLPGLFGRRIPPVVESFIIRDDGGEGAAAPGPGNGAENGKAPGHGRLLWIRNDLDAAMAEARATGRPVFLDFTGFV